MYKLSIITINFNNAEGLKKTMESVFSQSFNDFEYLIIDGGSTDGSVEIIKQNKKINYWISEKDNGIYDAMNKGILKSFGNYLLFLKIFKRIAKKYNKSVDAVLRPKAMKKAVLTALQNRAKKKNKPR